MDTNILTAERVRELLDYDPETGVFTRLIRSSPRINVGDVAGSLYSHGYLVIRVNWRRYSAHRLAWFYAHGRWPTDQLDHINGIRSDNRICNLREVTNGENQQNQRSPRRDNKSGFLGVYWHKKTKMWNAKIRINSKQYSLGYFTTPELAHEAYLLEKRRVHVACTI